MKKIEGNTIEKAKNIVRSKKLVLGLLSFVLVLAMIVVSAFSELSMNPSKWATSEFISKELIQVAIAVMSMVCFINIGKSGNDLDARSDIAKARKEFDQSITNIKNRGVNGFLQWVKQTKQVLDQEDENENLLHSVGITNKHYLDLSISELKVLMEQPYEKDFPNGKVYFNQITKEQFEAIEKIKNGKNAISFINPTEYLVLSKGSKVVSDSRKLSQQAKKETMTMVVDVGSRMISVLMFGMIMGAFVVESLSDGADITRNLMNLFTRMSTALISAFMGYMSGCKINDITAEYIQIKIAVHLQYLDDKEFKPLTEQEIAKRNFAEFVKKENENEIKKINDSTVYLPS